MSSDRYTKVVLSIIAVALTTIAVRPWVAEFPTFEALRPGVAQAQIAAPKYEVIVPKSWGKFVGFSNNNLLLEAPDQSLLVVDVEGRPPEYPKVKVIVRRQ